MNTKLKPLTKLPKKSGKISEIINNIIDHIKNGSGGGGVDFTPAKPIQLTDNKILKIDSTCIISPLKLDTQGNLYIDETQIKTIGDKSIFGTGSINLGYTYNETVLSISEGGSTAKANRSHAEGNKCIAEVSATNSHVEGYSNVVNGVASHAEGRNNTTTNEAEHAEGKYNKSIKGESLHTVGNGTSIVAKNAHLITMDGKHYIPGIGGYIGTETSLSNVKDLATFLGTLQEKAPIPIIQVATLSSFINLDVVPGLGRYTMIVDYRNGRTSLYFTDGIISYNYDVFVTRNEEIVQDFYYLDIVVIPKSVLATDKDIIICSPYRLTHIDE